MRTLIVFAAMCVFLAYPRDGRAQIGLAGEYEHVHPTFEGLHVSSAELDGWTVGASVGIGRGFAAIGLADGAYGPPFSTGIVIRLTGSVRPSLVSGGGGVRYTFAREFPVSPFADATLGVVHAQARVMGVDFLSAGTDSAAEYGAGAGLDVRLARSLALQGRVAYRRAMLFNQQMHRVDVSGGAVWLIHPSHP
jgi:hypothetical protein